MDDIIYTQDSESRYLGHSKARYGFMLFSPSFEGWLEFVFPVNPSSIEQGEEAATVITPTPGGKFIDRYGNPLKDILISGNTGWLPLKGLAGNTAAMLVRQKGPNLTPEEANNAKAAYAESSGYHTFHTLRALFRTYWQVFSSGKAEDQEGTYLVWVNGKDDETWVVEPMSFAMDRTGRSPMTYSYRIRLRTLSPGVDPGIESDPSSLATTATKASVRTVLSEVTTASQLMQSAAEVIGQYRALRTAVLSIIDTATSLSQQLNALVAGAADVLDFPRSVLVSCAANISTVFQTIESSSDLIADTALDLVEGLTTFRQQLDNLCARPELFLRKWATRWAELSKDFNTVYGIGGDALDSAESALSRSALVESTPMRGETITQFALRVTGDARRASEIILINKLRWPYFAASPNERAEGLVAPGDPVMVPVGSATNRNDNLVSFADFAQDKSTQDEVLTATTSSVTKSTPFPWRPGEWVGYTIEILSGALSGSSALVTASTQTTVTFSPALTGTPATLDSFRLYFQRLDHPVRPGVASSLGTDLLLQQDSVTGLWDFVKSGTGDLAKVSGEANFDQALAIKFRTSPGDVPLHKWFGLQPNFGTRATRAFRLRVFAEKTLRSDSRVEGVEQLRITTVRDQLQVYARLALKGSLRSEFTSPLI